MATTQFTICKDSDSGAKTLSGTAGDLIAVLSACAIVNTVYTTPDDAAWTDQTAEARSLAGTPFLILPTAAANDHCYIGHQRPFGQVRVNMGTLGVGGTYVWEYWNGSAWTTLTLTTDGTSGFTANGQATWTIPGSWATTALNSVTLYWIRVRATVAPSPIPTINYFSIFDWIEKYTGTNLKMYQMLDPSSVGFHLRVNDAGPGAGVAIEARICGFETATAISTATGPCPTTAQGLAVTEGPGGAVNVRKSKTADGTTRSYEIHVDSRGIRIWTLPGDTAGVYSDACYEEIYSFVASDAYRMRIVGGTVENAASGGASNAANSKLGTFSSSGTAAATGHYIHRGFAGTGGSIACGHLGNLSFGNTTDMIGVMVYPNGPDGGRYILKIVVTEASGNIRGRARGMYQFCHAIGNVADQDTISGAGDWAGKTFKFIKGDTCGISTTTIRGTFCIETSATVEAN